MKLLNMDQWDPAHLADLRAAFPDVTFAQAPTEGEAIHKIVDADAVWGHVSREVFLAAKRLRWLQHKGAGMNWMRDVPELIESDVIVTNAAGAAASTVAEHAFAVLLYLVRDLRSLDRAQRARTWFGPRAYRGDGLAGLTLGVLGLGRIGRAVAARAHAFDMTVIALDAVDVPQPAYIAAFWRPKGLRAFLRQADVVVVCVPFTNETQGMLGAEDLALMKPTAYLIVVSRGGIVDERTLVRMLREERLAGAALDVYAYEVEAGQHIPLPADSELWDVPNLVLTPHCASHSRQTAVRTKGILRENLACYLAGKPLINLVDKQLGY